MSQKEFDTWNKQKKDIHEKEKIPFFHEKELWFISMWLNVGYEQDGKWEEYARPVVIIKKCNKYCFLWVPLTTNKKNGKYYYSFDFHGSISTAILSQVRLYSSKRLIDNRGKIETLSFQKLKEKIRELFY